MERTRGVYAAIPGWRVRSEEGLGPAEERVRADVDLGEAVAEGSAPPTLRIWEDGRALVVTRQETRLPRFERAAERLGAEGWPVVVRASGGTAIPHMPGMLHLSMLYPRAGAPAFSIEDVYLALCLPLRLALLSLDIQTDVQEVPGSFCDGRFNLASGGRKLAGTAQAWRSGLAGTVSARGYVLAHATLHVDVDTGLATKVANRFYELAGGDRRCDPLAITTVAECLRGASDAAEVPSGRELVDLTRLRLREVLEELIG